MKVAIIGAGAYGTALGGILAENGYDIDYYDPQVEKERLKDTLSGAEAILVCVPSEVVMKLLSHLPKDKFLIIASKGFLSLRPFGEFEDYAVLSGAGFADDIKNSRKVKLTATDKRVVEMFSTDYVRFDTTDDKLGVLMCGALKNIYAIKAGMLRLSPKSKKKENYIYDVVKEMAEILHENGAKPSTIRLACGMKDLILTCGINSRNYRFGVEFSVNSNCKTDQTVEGLSALKRVKRGEIEIPENAKILKGLLEELEDAIK